VVECLPSKCEVLRSTTQKNKTKQNKKNSKKNKKLERLDSGLSKYLYFLIQIETISVAGF
jgi:hypothetical protein